MQQRPILFALFVAMLIAAVAAARTGRLDGARDTINSRRARRNADEDVSPAETGNEEPA